MKEVKIIKAEANNIIRRNTIQFTKIRVGSYARVSTDSEEQKNSYESQMKYYKELIDSKDDWELVDMYADEAISGTQVTKRTDFQRMINDAMNGKLDMIITKSISRFARNTLDTLKYVRMLKEKNVAVFFEKENINTLTMNGELLLVILSSMAQQESESIAGNVNLGLKMKMSRGELVGFNKCLGYDYDKTTKTISINEREAEIVRYVFDRYVNGAGCFVIAKELTNLGYENSKGQVSWTENGIRCIIKNEKYKGDLLLGKTFTVDPISHKRLSNMGEREKYYVENHHEPIISKELWEKAQEIRESRYSRSREIDNRRTLSKKHAFSSVVKCGFCGTTYLRRTWRPNGEDPKYVWSCIKKIKEGKKYCSESHSVAEEVLEKAFIEAYSLVLKNNKEIINSLIKTIDSILQEETDINVLRTIEKEQEDLKYKIDKLIDLRLDGNIADDIYEEKMNSFNEKLDEISTKLAELKKSEERELEYKNKIKRIRETFANYSEMKTFDKEVFQCVIEKVIVGCYNNDGTFDGDKIIFVFKTGDEVSGNINTTKTKRDVVDRYDRMMQEQNNNLCSYSSHENTALCSYPSHDTCGECSFFKIKIIGR